MTLYAWCSWYLFALLRRQLKEHIENFHADFLLIVHVLKNIRLIRVKNSLIYGDVVQHLSKASKTTGGAM